MICPDKSCCKMDIAFPLFVTGKEIKIIKRLCPDKADSFNNVFPCPFILGNGLCMIHESKPVDCRLFPFDIRKIDGTLYWIVWEVDCLIAQEEERFGEYVKDMEERFIPAFAPWLEAYSAFRANELASKYGFKRIKEVGSIQEERELSMYVIHKAKVQSHV